jgi:hypothetical protein
MFDLEIARVRSIPMALQRHPHGSIIHLTSGYHFGTTEFIVLYAILKRGALLPIAPVVCRLTMRAIAVWFKDTPVGSPRQCADFVGQWREELLASIWTSDPNRMSPLGQSLPKWTVRATSAFPLIATDLWTSRNVSNVPNPEVAAHH